jgi:hypothetical protein
VVKLFFDIETLPGNESLKGEMLSGITLPKKLKTDEEVEQWEEEEYRKTALNGDYGRILCIGYIKETPEGIGKGILKGEEPQIVREFWELAKDVDLFIGHNILDFDLKFIMKRSIILGVKPTQEVSLRRYYSERIYDTMHEWEKWSGYISLDKLARVLGFESSKDLLDGDGGKVYDYYKDGKLENIYEYCMADVELTRKIYNRMNFIE